MEQPLPKYKKIDMTTWSRREHFNYYRNTIKCGYSLTAHVDVTQAVAYSRKKGKRFYACFIYAAAKAVNDLDSMKMMITPDGETGIWDISHPNFTVFHKDDKTFSDLWTEYKTDFDDFYEEFESVITTYGDTHGIKGRPEQPANFFCISCVPWLDFTSHSTYSYSAEEMALFPIITFGKYAENNGHFTLPVTVSISHAAADGYHTSLFFQKLQDNLDAYRLKQ